MRLTGEQRYHQAVVKARIRAQRELRDFMSGKLRSCGDWNRKEQLCIIQEIERAYEEGLKDGRGK